MTIECRFAVAASSTQGSGGGYGFFTLAVQQVLRQALVFLLSRDKVGRQVLSYE